MRGLQVGLYGRGAESNEVEPPAANHSLRASSSLSGQVMEETGIDVEHLLNPDHVLEVTADGKLCTLFIVSGIDPDTTAFAPQTQGVSPERGEGQGRLLSLFLSCRSSFPLLTAGDRRVRLALHQRPALHH